MIRSTVGNAAESAPLVVSEMRSLCIPPLGWGAHIPVTPAEDEYCAEMESIPEPSGREVVD